MNERDQKGAVQGFTWLFIVSLLVRLFVPANGLDRLYSYDLLGGSPFLKIHPGTYMMLGATIIAPFIGKARLGKPYLAPVMALLATTALCGLSCILRSSTTALGLLIDNLICAAAGLFCLAQMGDEDKRMVFVSVMAGMALNCLLIFYEFFSHNVTFKPPIIYSAYYFRPYALLNHPLNNGLYLVAAIPAATLLRRPFYFTMGLAVFFLLATFASGARLASIVAVPPLFAAYLLASRRATTSSAATQRINLMLVAITSIALPLAIILALTSGFGYRFANSLFDVSAQSRVNVYALLAHLDTKSMMQGVGVEQMNLYASRLLDELVESPLVVAIFMFGLPLGLLFLGVMIYTLYEGARRADLSMKLLSVVFILVGAGNNVFVSKTPALLYALVLVYTSLSFSRIAESALKKPMTDADRRRALYAARRSGQASPAAVRLSN